MSLKCSLKKEGSQLRHFSQCVLIKGLGRGFYILKKITYFTLLATSLLLTCAF